jgi:tRNA(Ile)-lysidine synthase TilS/MesJ
MTKQQLRDYALEHRLEWVEDSTNATPAYLRNRLRRHITSLLLPAQKSALLDVWHRQVELRASIDNETVRLLQEHAQSRYFFTLLDDASALELLRAVILQVNSEGLTRPRLDRALIAIKTARPGTVYEAGSGILLRFTTHTFVVEAP